jgi:hypothetical protein
MGFHNASGEYAAVVTRNDAERSYGVQRQESLEAFTSCQQPLSSHSLRGVPNQQQILAALPAGFTYTDDGDNLPLEPIPPDSVTAWQIRRWLLINEISMADVDAAITAISDPALRESVRVDWEYAPIIERTHPMLEPLAEELGIEDLDAAFLEAELIG